MASVMVLNLRRYLIHTRGLSRCRCRRFRLGDELAEWGGGTIHRSVLTRVVHRVDVVVDVPQTDDSR